VDIYLPPSLYIEPRYNTFSTWVDHVPFGYDIVSAVRPELLVELGTYGGLSYFIFCQSMMDNNIDGSAFAIDTWQGDAQTGGYDNSIWQQVDDHSRDYYRGISYLLRMKFCEAVGQFDDNSIELLHIDGLHTYEAVKEDFESWYPKVKPGGVILFHDIAARLESFGVRQFWEEIESAHQTFAFKHGFGLGVLRKPGGDRDYSELEQIIFDGSIESKHRIRKLYAHISRNYDAMRRLRLLEKKTGIKSSFSIANKPPRKT